MQNTLSRFTLPFLQKRMAAFSLIELSMVLVIVGVLLGAIFKGQDLLDVAKVQSVVNDFQHIKIAIQTYHDTYSFYPGDDPKASQHFGSTVQNGNGDMIIDEVEAQNVWLHLNKASDFDLDHAPTSPFGGSYTIVYQPMPGMPGHWIQLANPNNTGVLTPKQAQKLMTKIDGAGLGQSPTRGLLRVMNGSDATSDNNICLNGDALNLAHSSPSCVIYMKM